MLKMIVRTTLQTNVVTDYFILHPIRSLLKYIFPPSKFDLIWNIYSAVVRRIGWSADRHCCECGMITCTALFGCLCDSLVQYLNYTVFVIDPMYPQTRWTIDLFMVEVMHIRHKFDVDTCLVRAHFAQHSCRVSYLFDWILDQLYMSF
jgi:hypothetical protein